MSITTLNPATGEPLATYDSHDDAQIEALLEAAHDATLTWGLTPQERRTTVVANLANVLRERSDELAGLITAEMGKPLFESAGELAKSAVTADSSPGGSRVARLSSTRWSPPTLGSRSAAPSAAATAASSPPSDCESS